MLLRHSIYIFISFRLETRLETLQSLANNLLLGDLGAEISQISQLLKTLWLISNHVI